MNETLKKDLAFIENKYHKTNEPFNSFNRMGYHGWECDPATGLDDTEMAEALEEYLSGLTDTDHAVIKAKAFAFVLDHMRFEINEHDYFPCLYNWSRPLNHFIINRWLGEVRHSDESSAFVSEYTRSGDVTIWMDYDHSVPDWEALYSLGFAGIKKRAAEYREARGGLSEKERGYFDSIETEYSAILRLIGRLRDYAAEKDFEKAPFIAGCLDRLATGAPVTTLDRLMLIYLYFMLSESVDSYQVRSLGSGLDHDLDAVYKADIAAGRFSEDELDSFIAYFLLQFSAIGNYWGQPLYIGGRGKVCDMTCRFLDIYDELGIYNPKIQVKYSKDTPDELLKKICDMIRRGHSSFVFVCEDNIIKSFELRGVSRERAGDFDVKGCYEFALRAGEFSTAPFYVNLLAPVVRALGKVGDDADYKTLEDAYFDELGRVFEGGITYCDEMEKYIGSVNPAPMLSATITRSLENARDAYADGAELNTTAIVVGGIGSAVDALMAVKTLVFDEKRVTLGEFKKILADNWSDEKLRARALNCPHKFGNGDIESDALAARIADFTASYQGRPNSRGGYYKVTIHSARQFIEQGRKIPATPDGRLFGEETSKNASPTQGMDRNGVTALINSALATKPWRFTEGFGFDVMIHQSAVKGGDGLMAMLGLLRAYDLGGGSTIQFNITDAETLRAAQREPEKYSNLQIRVCGWNALWNNMAKSEQDKYIERAEHLQ